jgi:hypothetical protein
MGQYYMPVNVNKFQYLYSHHFDCGLKLMEHAYNDVRMVQAVVRLLSPGGGWYKCNMVWAGDYGDIGAFVPSTHQDLNLYSYAESHGKNALEGYKIIDTTENYDLQVKRAKRISKKWLKTLPLAEKFLTNHTKKICINLYGETSEIHPLPILTSNGNGQGSGDYHGTHMNLVGSWAGDIISIEPNAIFKVIPPINFKESKESDILGDKKTTKITKKEPLDDEEITIEKTITVQNTEVPIKKKRGRPRKNPIISTQTVIPTVSIEDVPEEDRSLLELLG